jgi:hypothetical protein
MTCRTANCGRAVPWTGHGWCRECLPVVFRTGQPPGIAREPEWMRRRREVGLPAKDMSAAA